MPRAAAELTEVFLLLAPGARPSACVFYQWLVIGAIKLSVGVIISIGIWAWSEAFIT